MSEQFNENSILICGLPDSGKTTFLGALSYLMTSRETATELSHDGLPEERAFLNKLANRWCQCEPMERTRPGDNENIRLKFKSKDGKTEINFPDLAGETWRQVWELHHSTKELTNLANDANSIIAFIHADDIRKPLSVVRAQELANALGGANIESPPTEQNGGQEGMEDTYEKWDPAKHPPTQAIIVSLLQQLATHPMGKKRSKVAIVLSAWDQVTECTPDDFVKKELPLLYQYLNSNFDYEFWKVYGVSAQGGHLSNREGDPDDKEKLLNVEMPSNRISVQEGTYTSNDLTAILSWAI